MLSIINTLVKALSASDTVEQIILYGSRARGDNEPRSDIDLAVFCPSASSSEWMEFIRLMEASQTLYFIDLVRLDEASRGFKERILAEGKILYERNQGKTISS